MADIVQVCPKIFFFLFFRLSYELIRKWRSFSDRSYVGLQYSMDLFLDYILQNQPMYEVSYSKDTQFSKETLMQLQLSHKFSG